MKKSISLLAAFLIFFSLNVSSQNKKSKNTSSASDGSKCFGTGTNVINVGVGFLGAGYYKYGRSGNYKYGSSPAFSISYERGLAKLGPGYLGAGAYFGYKTAYYRYNDYYYKGERYYYRHNWTYMFLAARIAYHPDALIFAKGEVYFGGVLGARIETYSYENNSPDPDRDLYRVSSGSVRPGYSLFVGGRYYFTNSIGGFAEIGYGISYLTLGLSFKF